MRILLRDLAPGQAYAIQFRSNDGHGGTSDWSQVQRFTTTNDTMPPANVLNLGLFTQDASYFASWDKVTTNHDGTPLKDFRAYHVHVSSSGGSGTGDFYPTVEHFEFTKAQNLATFGTFQTALTFTVTAVDRTWNESVTPATLTFDPSAPSIPSTPVVSNYIGLLQVTWDTLNNVGGGMPSNFSYCEVHVSTTNGFTPSSSTLAATINLTTPKYVIAGLTYGTTYYVKLIAVNALGKKSNPSAQGSGSPQRITGLDVQNGQISAEQINWVATGIPGGNAYYQSTAPTGGTYTTNDIWYDTGNAYTPHHWTGTAWGPAATDVGFIVGTKILAGTLTANAIGTNQIITASANIANAVIDDAHISNVSAAKLTAGTVSSDVVISGRFATALTGARVEVNANGLQKFDTDGVTKLVDINGTGTSVLTGQFQTDLSGNRRVVIGASGSVGDVLFQPPGGGEQGFIIGYTQSTGTEAIQLGITTSGISSTGNALWNRINYNNQGWSVYQAVKHDFSFTTSGTGFFVVREMSNGTSTASSNSRLVIDTNGMTYYASVGEGAHGRLSINNGGVTFYDNGQNANIQIDSSSTIKFYGLAPLKSGNGTAGAGGWIQVASGNDANVGSVMQFFTALVSGSHYGGIVFYAQDASISNPRFEFQLWDGSAFIPLWASAFTVSSDAAFKSDINDFSGSALDVVNSLRVREYYRNPGTGMNRRAAKEIGLIAQEAHPLIVEDNEKSGKGIELYRLATLHTKSVQELHTLVKTLEERIARLEGNE